MVTPSRASVFLSDGEKHWLFWGNVDDGGREHAVWSYLATQAREPIEFRGNILLGKPAFDMDGRLVSMTAIFLDVGLQEELQEEYRYTLDHIEDFRLEFDPSVGTRSGPPPFDS